jgi:hypothetical protein
MATHTKAQLEAIIAELGTKIATLEQAQVQDIKRSRRSHVHGQVPVHMWNLLFQA